MSKNYHILQNAGILLRNYCVRRKKQYSNLFSVFERFIAFHFFSLSLKMTDFNDVIIKMPIIFLISLNNQLKNYFIILF